jgi:hypothetical protein
MAKSTGSIRTAAASDWALSPASMPFTATALGDCPAANNRPSASSTPLSLLRAARCKIRTYSWLARAG